MSKINVTTTVHEIARLRAVRTGSSPDLSLEITALMKRVGDRSHALVPVLRELRRTHGTLPPETLTQVAVALGVSYAKVHMVASFYEGLAARDPAAVAA